MPRRSRSVARPRVRASRLAPDERRAQLLRCALRVFARRGIGAARHAEIAREGRVSLSLVFVYFPTRAALVRAVLDEVARFYAEQAERMHASEGPAAQVVLAHAETFAGSVDSHPDYARVWLEWSTAMRDEIWPRYLAFQEQIVHRMAETIRRGQRDGSVAPSVDAEDEARVLIGCAHMVAQMKFTRVAPDRIRHFLRTLVESTVGTP